MGSSPDGIVSCTCYEKSACLEVKCPYSINYTSPIVEKIDMKIVNKKMLNIE